MPNARDIEKTICRVAKEFRQGTVNFRNEAGFRCLLFNYIRGLDGTRVRSTQGEGEYDVELVHAEFPTPIRTNQRYDLAIMKEEAANRFDELYYEDVGQKEWAKRMLLRAAIEIKFRNRYPEYDDEMKKDIKKLKSLLRKRKERKGDYGYFVLFIDMDVDWREDWRYKQLLASFKEASKGVEGLKIYCIPGKSGDALKVQKGSHKRVKLQPDL